MSATSAPAAVPPAAAAEQHEPIAAAEVATAVDKIQQKQEETEKTEQQDAVATAPSQTVPALSQAEREKEAGRIRQSAMLPPALRECLARVVETSAVAGADGKARVPIDDALRAIEEAVPEFLRQDRSRVTPRQHPAGDVFFHGNPDELTDAQAEELAHKQLARSGLLRGQRARVAVD
jgi:hypothetical protein